MAHNESFKRTSRQRRGSAVTLAEAPDVLTVGELGQILRIGRNQAYALVNSGRVWSCRIGGSIRVPKVALERFVRGEVAAAAEAGGN